VNAANRLAEQPRHESCLILPQALARSVISGIVLVMITWSIGAASSRSMAGPDSTPCTAQAKTRAAPFAFKALAAFTIVPAVSMMSSCRMQVRPATSPITFITSALPSSVRRLSMIASSAPRRLA